jgi:hypothetical protein
VHFARNSAAVFLSVLIQGLHGSVFGLAGFRQQKRFGNSVFLLLDAEIATQLGDINARYSLSHYVREPNQVSTFLGVCHAENVSRQD